MRGIERERNRVDDDGAMQFGTAEKKDKTIIIIVTIIVNY